MARSEASSPSSAEVRRLWEEPTEEIGLKSDSVGILALLGRGGCQEERVQIISDGLSETKPIAYLHEEQLIISIGGLLAARHGVKRGEKAVN
jgi:hypothetical protein